METEANAQDSRPALLDTRIITIMETEANAQDSRPALLDTLTKLGTAAFDPRADPAAQAEGRDAFEHCIQRSSTVNLIPALNTLIQPGRTPEWLRSKFMTVLTLVPLRPDGVRATLEFVFSVHPSSTTSLSEMARPQKQGANITQEALTMAARLLASPPSAGTPETWFAGIAPQLLQLLDGYDGLEMTKVASYVIGFGILGRKKFGAPGTAGWAAFASPLLEAISPTQQSKAFETAGVIDLTRDAVLVSSNDLSAALRRLQSLIISHPNPGLTKRLISPVLLSLWAISSWPGAVGSFEEDYCVPAKNMLKIYLRIDASPANILRIITNLSYDGEEGRDGLAWRFAATKDHEVEILQSYSDADQEHLDESTLAQVAQKSAALVELIESISADEDISTVFLDLLRHWLQPSKTNVKNQIMFRAGGSSETSSANLLSRAKEGSVLQKMMEKYPEKLVKRPDQLLILVSEILQQAEADASVALALSLLNLVVTVPGFQRRHIKSDVLETIESSLERISHSGDEEVVTTARNLSLLLKYRDELDDPAESLTAPTDRQIEDRKTYNLALSYITQSDSPPPVRSEGINLIQGLVQTGSPILDVPAVLVLMSSLLEESEDYINLRVIKVFTQLAHNHPKSTTSEILERYVDSQEKATIDTRLRFGEALVQVIERLGETFTGETAQQVGEALLFIAGRRSHRAKTAARQTRAAKLRELKKDRDEGVDDDADEDITAEEQARQDILKSIVEGWQSKRGSEDVRIRASALSIFAVGIHTNIAGIGSHLVSAAIDLCLGILSMEQGIESGILRRSAIIVILEFVRSLAAAKDAGKRVGFGLTDQSREDILRILRYIFDTDNDGLVKQHAADVIESLENWQMSQIMGQLKPSEPAISQLAGLAINPVTTISADGNRPKIEEIE